MDTNRKPLKKNKEFKLFVDEIIDKYLTGKYEKKSSRNMKRLSITNDMLKDQIRKNKSLHIDLKQLDLDTKKAKRNAKRMTVLSKEIHIESYWYNKKFDILIWGSIGLVLLAFSLWFLRIFMS